MLQLESFQNMSCYENMHLFCVTSLSLVQLCHKATPLVSEGVEGGVIMQMIRLESYQRAACAIIVCAVGCPPLLLDHSYRIMA